MVNLTQNDLSNLWGSLRLNFMVFLLRHTMVIKRIFQGMRVLVVRDFSKKFYPIRNCFGVFKNQQLPKKFVFCQNMREREECSYQNACLFSHSITEMAIWQIQKQSKSFTVVISDQYCLRHSNICWFLKSHVNLMYFFIFSSNI